MFNMNSGMGGGANRSLYNPFGETRGWADPAMQGAISLPEKVMGLTCLLVLCALGGIVLGAAGGLNTIYSGGSFLWFIAMFILVMATQAMAARPGIGAHTRRAMGPMRSATTASTSWSRLLK